MSGDEFYLCETCREKIDPAAPGTVRAVEMIHTVDMSGTQDIEGQGVLFHQGCFPSGSRRYRRKD